MFIPVWVLVGVSVLWIFNEIRIERIFKARRDAAEQRQYDLMDKVRNLEWQLDQAQKDLDTINSNVARAKHCLKDGNPNGAEIWLD